MRHFAAGSYALRLGRSSDVVAVEDRSERLTCLSAKFRDRHCARDNLLQPVAAEAGQAAIEPGRGVAVLEERRRFRGFRLGPVGAFASLVNERSG
jgi:hypothetical protein